MIEIVNKKNKDEKFYIKGFDFIIRNSEVVRYNNDQIIIPNKCVFLPESKDTFFKRLLNSSLDVIKLEDEKFNEFLKKIKDFEKESFIIKKESRIKPLHNILINLEKLSKDLIYLRIDKNIVVVNGFVFTDSEIEYQGFGLLTSKEPIFVTFEELSKIKELLTLEF